MPNYTKQAGAVICRRNGEKVEFLLVRARRNPRRWIFPKGHIEPGEKAQDAALREMREESGADGDLVERLGSARISTGSRNLHVQYYLVAYTGEVPPGEERDRAWMRRRLARKLLVYDQAIQILDKAVACFKRSAAYREAELPSPPLDPS